MRTHGERNRVLYVLKSRGMVHSNQVREFLISDKGIDLVDAYIGPSGVLTGAARVAQAANEKARTLVGEQNSLRRKRELERKGILIERQIASLHSDHEAEKDELQRAVDQVATRTRALTAEQTDLARLRHSDGRIMTKRRP